MTHPYVIPNLYPCLSTYECGPASTHPSTVYTRSRIRAICYIGIAQLLMSGGSIQPINPYQLLGGSGGGSILSTPERHALISDIPVMNLLTHGPQALKPKA